VITLELERVIRRPVQAVWDFFSDFEAMPSWQPEFRELVKQTAGPVEVGTVFRYRRKVPFGEQQGTMEITEWDPPRRLGFSAEPGPVLPRGSWTFTSDDATTRVVDHLDAELQGLLRLFSPILRRQFAQEGSRHLDEAVRRLEAASAAPKATSDQVQEQQERSLL
jgi:uncharacterized protein YndB with AHSA1/START domain